LCKTYEKLMTTLQVSYENVKFAASDVIRKTLCQSMLFVEYFELEITDNQSEDFLRMLSKNDLPFFEENLKKSYLADLQKTDENLTTNLGNILLMKYRRSGPWAHRPLEYDASLICLSCAVFHAAFWLILFEVCTR